MTETQPQTESAINARSWGVTVLSRGGAQLLQLGATLVLARLLVPADFGLVAMVMSAVGLANLFRDLGLSAATIRQPNLQPGQINTLFWINTGFGALMAALVAALAPVLQHFYTDPRVGPVTLLLSLTFFFGGLKTQHTALLQRDLRFGALARINLIMAFTNAALAIFLAWRGAGYWSLVWATLASAFVGLLVTWRECRWRPARPAFDPQVWPMLSFGGYFSVFLLLGYFGQNLHNLMIGLLWGATVVGLFNRAFLLTAMTLGYVLDPLNIIVPPALARLQEKPEEYSAFFLRSVMLTSLLAAPLSIYCLLFSHDIVEVLLGAKWLESADFLFLLAFGMLPQALCFTTGWLYLARGQSRRMMQWGMLGWTFIIVTLVIGSRFGAYGIAAANSVAMTLMLWPCMAYACHGEPVTPGKMLRVALPIGGAALAAGFPAWGTAYLLESVPVLVRLAVCTFCFGLAYFGLLMTMPTLRRELKGLLGDAYTRLRSRFA